MDQQLFSLLLVVLTAIATCGGAYLNHRWTMQREKAAITEKSKREQIERAYRHIIELRKIVFVVYEFLQSTQFMHIDKLQVGPIDYQKAIRNIGDIERKLENICIGESTLIQESEAAVRRVERDLSNIKFVADSTTLLMDGLEDAIESEYDVGSEILLIGDLYAPELRPHLREFLRLCIRLKKATLAYSRYLLDYIKNDDDVIKIDFRHSVEGAIKKFLDHSSITISEMSNSIK